jgi:hypothetical protein
MFDHRSQPGPRRAGARRSSPRPSRSIAASRALDRAHAASSVVAAATVKAGAKFPACRESAKNISRIVKIHAENSKDSSSFGENFPRAGAGNFSR